MNRAIWTLTAGAALLALTAALAGMAPLSRLALESGMPGLAARLAPSPELRGIALFRAGHYAEAQAEFASIDYSYNAGLAAAGAGDYAAALVAWERRMAADPGDAEATANHRIVTAVLAGTEFAPVARPDDRDGEIEQLAAPGQGKGRAAGQGDDATNRNAGFWMPEIMNEGLRRVATIFDAQFIAADDRWLTTLEDQPGIYLRSRLAFEQKARNKAGTALPEAEDPR